MEISLRRNVVPVVVLALQPLLAAVAPVLVIHAVGKETMFIPHELEGALQVDGEAAAGDVCGSLGRRRLVGRWRRGGRRVVGGAGASGVLGGSGSPRGRNLDRELFDE